jgi:tRNA-(ms[2]io[6]A)-hydroxylase
MENRPTFSLLTQTPPDWVEVALADFDAFLIDHASCERKASSVGISFVVRYPDRKALLDPMIQFAREELEHFHQVFRLIEERGLSLREDYPDEYVNLIMAEVRTGRDERLLDRLLVSAVIEARGAERLGIVAEKLSEPRLKLFYERLTRAEKHHQSFFIEMAQLFFAPEVVTERLSELLEKEAEAIRNVPYRSALH